MSKRYGRNQKRAHRATIAHLTHRLAMESTACMYLPEEGVPDLESFVHVMDWSVTEDGSRTGPVYHSASVVVAVSNPDLMELLYNQTKVQFKGTQYVIANSSFHHHMAQIELQLTGVTG